MIWSGFGKFVQNGDKGPLTESAVCALIEVLQKDTHAAASALWRFVGNGDKGPLTESAVGTCWIRSREVCAKR